MKMTRIVSIVEGHGEEEAVPILLQRIVGAIDVTITTIRVPRQKIVKEEELERAVELAAERAGAGGRILILLDADADCPAQLAPDLLRRARAARGDRAIRVVLAKIEYEAWFLAAADSIAGKHGIDAKAAAPADPEAVRGAKEWLTKRMPAGQSYRPTRHQATLTKEFNMDAARRAAPSFDKLWRDVTALLKPAAAPETPA